MKVKLVIHHPVKEVIIFNSFNEAKKAMVEKIINPSKQIINDFQNQVLYKEVHISKRKTALVKNFPYGVSQGETYYTLYDRTEDNINDNKVLYSAIIIKENEPEYSNY